MNITVDVVEWVQLMTLEQATGTQDSPPETRGASPELNCSRFRVERFQTIDIDTAMPFVTWRLFGKEIREVMRFETRVGASD